MRQVFRGSASAMRATSCAMPKVRRRTLAVSEGRVQGFRWLNLTFSQSWFCVNPKYLRFPLQAGGALTELQRSAAPPSPRRVLRQTGSGRRCQGKTALKLQ